MQKTYTTSLQAEGMPWKLWDLLAAMLNCPACVYGPVQSELKWKYKQPLIIPTKNNYWKKGELL